MPGATPGVDTCMPWNDKRRPGYNRPDRYRCWYDDEGEHCPGGTIESGWDKDSKTGKCWGGNMYWSHCFPPIDSYSQEDKDKLSCCLGRKMENECHPDYCRKDGKSLGLCNSFLVAHCSDPENLFDATGCIQLKTKDPEIYKYVMKENCKGDNFKKTECKEFCRDNPNECQTELLEYCKDKATKPEYEDICACYYPPRVYMDIADEFEREWQVPAQYLDHRPKCAYPQCKTAVIGPPDSAPCAPQHISSCINNIDIDVGGKASIGSVILTNDQDCGNVYTKPVTRPATTTSAADTKKEESSDEGNNGGFLGTGISFNLWMAIIGGGIGALILMIAVAWLLFGGQKSRSEKLAKALDRTNGVSRKRRQGIQRPYQAQ